MSKTVGDVINSIPHDIREMILKKLPEATANLSNPAFQFLWEAYFIYVDPDAVKKTDCPTCLGNVLKNWIYLSEGIEAVEKEYNTLEKI